MFTKLRLRRPSHATVVAYLALFVALGGTAAYATHETILSSDIVDGEVTTLDLANGAVTSQKVGQIFATRARKTVNQSVPTAAGTLLTFNSEVFDFGSMHNNTTNNSRLIAPIAGVYQVSAGVNWATNSVGVRSLSITDSLGNPFTTSATAATSAVGSQSASTLVRLAAGGYVLASVFQNSGGPLNATSAGNTHFAMHWVGAG